jgi:hypothetical protein
MLTRKTVDFISNIFMLVLIDLLFLPRITSLYGISFTYFLIPIILLIGRQHNHGRANFLIFTLSGLIIISALYGQASLKDSDFPEDIKRAVQLAFYVSFSLLPLTRIHICKQNFNKIINIFYLYLSILLLVFLISPETYVLYMQLIYPEALGQLEENVYSFRFGYFFTDPNTLGYLLVLVFSAHAIFNKLKTPFYQIILVSVLVLTTQSRGAMIAFLLSIMYLSIVSPKIYLRSSILFASFLLIISTFLNFNPVEVVMSVFETRANLEEEAGMSVGGGRLEKYLHFFSQFSFLPIGTGYTLYKDGSIFLPHSDFIRIVLSYGVVVLFGFIYLIYYRFKHNFVVYASITLPFFINTLIDDYRLLPLFFVLVASILNINKLMYDDADICIKVRQGQSKRQC